MVFYISNKSSPSFVNYEYKCTLHKLCKSTIACIEINIK